MPIYEYRCKACGHTLEAIQKISEEPLKDCPACGTPELSKLVSAAGFRLKGGGWYETDFKGDKDKRKNLAGATAEGKTEAAKTDSSTAATTTSTPATPAPAATSAATD